MRHKCLYLSLVTWMVTTSVWADEPVRARPTGRQPLKQRVDPKVLREALALPEYQGKVQEPPAVSLDDLQSLAEKLQKNGDSDSANLLQRFIHEHRPAKQSVRLVASGEVAIQIQCQFIDVNLDELPANSILRTVLPVHPGEKSAECQKELHQLVAAKKAKLVSEPVLITKPNVAARISEGGEIPIPTPGGEGTVTIEFREYGTAIEILPILTTGKQIRLQTLIEISEKDLKNAIESSGTTIPGFKTRKSQHTVDVNVGEASVCSCGDSSTGTKTFVIMTVTHQN